MPKNEKVIIIEGSRSGYSLDQVNYPITVGELIKRLSRYDKDTKVYLGNDMQRYEWYTYGSPDTMYAVNVDEEGEFNVDDLEEVY